VKRHIKTWKAHVVCKVGDMALSVPVKNKCNDCYHGKAVIIKYHECVWFILLGVFCTVFGFGGLGGSVLAFSTQVRGFKPGRSRQIFKGEKILSTPSFREEVKPSVPCRRFAACKRSLNGMEVVISAKLPGQHSRPQFPLLPLGSLTSWRTWRHLVVKSGNI